jgi:hypothetical protein
VGLGDWLIALIGRRRWESKSTEAEAEAAAADTSRDANALLLLLVTALPFLLENVEGKWNTGDA